MDLPRGQSVEQIATRADSPIRLVLLYGPDEGLAHERALKIISAAGTACDDPFRVTRLTGAQLNDDAARLSDEASAMCFMGGRRIVWLTDVTDASGGKAIRSYIDAPSGDALVIVEAGDLTSKSTLRASAKASSAAVSVPCYLDSNQDIEQVIVATMQAAGVTLSSDALHYLATHLGSDRMISRSELDKLVLYAAGQKQIDLHDAIASVGDNAALSVSDVVASVAAGNLPALDRTIARAFNDGETAIGIIRAVIRHFQRLHFVSIRVSQGISAKDAIAKLEPKVFWTETERLAREIRLWQPQSLSRALRLLLSTEIRCKTTGIPADVICSETLLTIAKFVNTRSDFV